jgi:hypothetical protein
MNSRLGCGLVDFCFLQVLKCQECNAGRIGWCHRFLDKIIKLKVIFYLLIDGVDTCRYSVLKI